MEKDYSKTNTRPSFYAMFFEDLRKIAIKHGYALALHGSMANDLDIIAIPWVETENVSLAEDMVDEMVKTIGGIDFCAKARVLNVGFKPHGRMVFTISLFGDVYIDVSVMPTDEAYKVALAGFMKYAKHGVTIENGTVNA